MTFDLSKIIRPNIAALAPYSCARDEFSGEASVYLDANENPFNAPLNRYPDPMQLEIKSKLAAIRGCEPENIFLGNGSDEAIDLLFRAFCNPGVDNYVAIEPTYGMYKVAAGVNDCETRNATLSEEFELLPEKVLEACNENTKLIFLCSPNNPSGNTLNSEAIQTIVDKFTGLVVIDEAYIDFSPNETYLPKLAQNANVVVLQTFSKAWGMAGIRLGMAYASKEIIEVLNKIKYPYNVNLLTQEKAIEALNNYDQILKWTRTTLLNKEVLEVTLSQLPAVQKIYPSQANFLLVKIENASKVYLDLQEHGIIVRDRSRVKLCDDCLRITVGTETENAELLSAISAITKKTIA